MIHQHALQGLVTQPHRNGEIGRDIDAIANLRLAGKSIKSKQSGYILNGQHRGQFLKSASVMVAAIAMGIGINDCMAEDTLLRLHDSLKLKGAVAREDSTRSGGQRKMVKMGDIKREEGQPCPTKSNSQCINGRCYRSTRNGDYICCQDINFCDFWDAGCVTGFFYCANYGDKLG